MNGLKIEGKNLSNCLKESLPASLHQIKGQKGKKMLIITKRGIKNLIFSFLYLSELSYEHKTSEKHDFDNGFKLGEVSAYRSLVENLDLETEYSWYKNARNDIKKKG